MNLPPLGLQTNTATTPQGSYDARNLTFVLGHEIQHGFNAPGKRQATHAFLADVEAEAKKPQAVHDYTGEIGAYIQAGRVDEAKAEIAGWNALSSREKQIKPSTTIDDMGRLPTSRVMDFVKIDNSISPSKVLPLPGINFNPDGSLAMDAANVDPALVASTGKTAADIAKGNIDAMGKHYFDRPAHSHALPGDRPVGLGENPNPNLRTDYTNFYGTWAVENAIAQERRYQPVHAAKGIHPQMTIDMASIGLKEDLMEQNGIQITLDKATPQPYQDTSRTPARHSFFNHTQDGSVNAADDHRHVPIAPGGTPGDVRPLHEAPHAASRPLSDMRDPRHPDHALYQQAYAGVVKLDQDRGRAPDANSERLAAALAAQAKAEGLDRISHVALSRDGSRAFAVDTPDINAEWRKRADVDVATAVQQPVEASNEQLQRTNQRLAQEQKDAPPLRPDDPGMGGPKL